MSLTTRKTRLRSKCGWNQFWSDFHFFKTGNRYSPLHFTKKDKKNAIMRIEINKKKKNGICISYTLSIYIRIEIVTIQSLYYGGKILHVMD